MEERSMLFISTRIHGSIPAATQGGTATPFDITLECSEKTLIGFSDPNTENVSFDSDTDVTGTLYVGKSNLENGTGTAKGDWETYEKLMQIKKSPIPVEFDLEYTGRQTGNKITCSKVMLGQLGGFSGTLAPQFPISFLPKGGKVEDLPTFTAATP